MNLQTFAKGDVIFRQNQRPDKLYLVESGDFKLITKADTFSFSVKTIEVAILSRGSLLAEIGFILEQAHFYTCIC